MNTRNEVIQQLSSPDIKLTQLLQAIESLEQSAVDTRTLSIGVSANISIDLLSTFLRKEALLAGFRLEPRMGSHDDAMNDVKQFVDDKLDGMILLNFFDNLRPSFEAQLPLLSKEQVENHLNDFVIQCRFVFENAKGLPFVFVPELHRFGEAPETGEVDVVAETIALFNHALRKEASSYPNVRLLDSNAIISAIGQRHAFDHRFYFQMSTPYTRDYCGELANKIFSASRNFNGSYYKALVLDCDNTLWGGIVGEDLQQNIKLDPHSYPGNVFWRIQQDILNLERNGVLLCLCSKNNPADVYEVLENHPHSILKSGHIVVSKVNWSDKVSNLRDIATELNIGLDSLVFVDDSPFECEAVQAALPMIRVFQVPKAPSAYPKVMKQITDLFISGSVSNESRSKTEQYRMLQAAQKSSATFSTHEEYLASLNLRVTLRKDDAANIARIGELTLKSNQFNLTTLRQSATEIKEKMDAPDWTVYSLNVEDKFGDSGLTGVAILHWSGETAIVEAFLMSCRVIGRGVEFSIWPHVLQDAAAKGCTVIEAKYGKTQKNAQVSDFYDRLGFAQGEEAGKSKVYRANIETLQPAKAEWIKVIRDE